jgi:hypothetical protein
MMPSPGELPSDQEENGSASSSRLSGAWYVGRLLLNPLTAKGLLFHAELLTVSTFDRPGPHVREL